MASLDSNSNELECSQNTCNPEAHPANVLHHEVDDNGATRIKAPGDPEPRRHSDLWFSDGSVICRAEDTLFKVHSSVLCRHSEFFRDMFSLPQPHPSEIAASDTINLPLIPLYDKAYDVANLFLALYDGPQFGINDQSDFNVVSGLLRLSTKYLIKSLRTKALAHLNLAWPETLKSWEIREDIARRYEVDGVSPTHRFYPHPIAVINLSMEVDAPSLLPAAMYDLSRYSYPEIFGPKDDLLHSGPLLPPCQLSLSEENMQRFCIGKEASHQYIPTLITAMGSSQSARQSLNSSGHRRHGGVCISTAACRKDFSELVELATQHYLFDRERGYCDPLYVAEELGQLKSAELSECKACANSLETWAAREREKMWKMIPIWFRLK